MGQRGRQARADVHATALFHAMTVEGMVDLDLACTSPLGSPWGAVQVAAQAWSRERRPPDIGALSPTDLRPTDLMTEENTP